MKNTNRYPITISTLLLILILEALCFVRPSEISATTVIKSPHVRQAGYASYYSYECAHQPMANGKAFDPEKRTCASWFYDFGTVLLVRSLDTGLTTEVVVTDRGPNKRFVRKGRIIDLSMRAFKDICDTERGLTRVEIMVRSMPSRAMTANRNPRIIKSE
ncbi:MAG: septal ring lytic transglycosylase RlpA family protein [Candidatus Omnitrophota bacterium]